MHDSPISRAQSIEHLLKLMKAHPLATGLGKLAKERDHALGVIAPASLAQGIVRFAPELASRNRLSVAVILNHADTRAGTNADPMRLVTAVLDGGQWYRLVPLMMGISATIDVTVYGDPQLNQYASSIAKRLSGSPISVAFRELSVLQNDEADINGHDVVLMPHPGFDLDASILQSAALQAFARSRKPIIVVSSDQQSLTLELGYVWCHGYDTCEKTHRNPVHLNLMSACDSGWGHSVGLINGFSERDPEEVSLATESLRVIALALGQRTRFEPPGGLSTVAPLERVLLGERAVIVLLAGLVMDESTGEILHYDRNKRSWACCARAEEASIAMMRSLRTESDNVQYIEAMAIAANVMAPVLYRNSVAA